MCGLVRPIFRLPYVPLSREQREHGAKLLRAVQQHIPGCKVKARVLGYRGLNLHRRNIAPNINNVDAVQDVRVMDDEEFILIHSAGEE